MSAARAAMHPALEALATWLEARGIAARRVLDPDVEALPDGAELTRWAAQAGHAPRAVAFVAAAAARNSALQYERRTLLRGEVAVRNGSRHDACNALAWAALPRTKWALNALHCRHASGGARRGTVRDAATLLDEFGALVICDAPELVELWAAHAWAPLFHERRADVLAHMRIAVLGHGLMHALAHPFPALTARALVLETAALPDPDFASIDGVASAWLTHAEESLTPGRLLPLPIAAWPGWSADGGPDKFGDRQVFRGPRKTRDPAESPCEPS